MELKASLPLLPLRDIEPEWLRPNFKTKINNLILQCTDNQKIYSLANIQDSQDNFLVEITPFLTTSNNLMYFKLFNSSINN